MTTGVRWVPRRQTCEGCTRALPVAELFQLDIGTGQHLLCLRCIEALGQSALQEAARLRGGEDTDDA